MKAGIVFQSTHHGNTRRVATVIAQVLDATVWAVADAVSQDGGNFDVVGFGYGIYFGRHDKALRRLVSTWPRLPPKAFIFSTAGIASLAWLWHRSMTRLLRQRGCEVVGEFCCPGWDTVGPLWLVGGLNRQRPNAHDLADAARFAEELETRCSAPSEPHKNA